MTILARPIYFAPPKLRIQNKLASLNEFNVGIALELEGIEYKFRVTYWSGKVLRGGVEVDFVYGPFDDLLEVYGDYWHSGQFTPADKLRNNLIETSFGKKIVFVWGHESETIDEARNTLREKLRL